VSSISVVILIWRLCQNILSMASNSLQSNFWQFCGYTSIDFAITM
jgi:hypothetical protein